MIARGPTKPFELGAGYITNEGHHVVCIEVNRECARFDDGEEVWHSTGGYFHRHTHQWIQQTWHRGTTGWRYNREQDRGRVTGTAFDHSDPRCIIPESAS